MSKQEEKKHPSLELPEDIIKLSEHALQIEEVDPILKEVVEKVRPIIQKRIEERQLYEDINQTMQQLVTKIDSLTKLKSVNAELERDVLEKLKAKL